MAAVEQKLTYGLKLALVYTSAIIRNLGYVSKKRAMDGTSGSGATPTSQTLARWLKADPDAGAVQVKAEDTVRADVALAWLAKLSPTNEFYQSLIKLNAGGYRSVDNGQITKSDFGFVACVYSTMEREAAKELARATAEEAAEDSEYMGKLKARAEFFVKLVGKKYSDNVGCYIYKVKDRKGNLGVFFSSDSGLAELNDCILAKMTPKRHSVSDYHGGKETVFNRVKVVRNVGSPS